MKTLITLFLASIVLSGCIVSPLYGPDGRERGGHEHRDHDDNHYNDYHEHGDSYRN